MVNPGAGAGRVFVLHTVVCGDDMVAAGTPVWFEQVRVADLLPGAADSARAQIPAPVVSFQNLDRDFGWAYVTVAQDFRVTGLAPVSATASATAGPLTAWVTVTATPKMVRFDPGEPGGHQVECGVDAAQAPFVAEVPGECSYTYVNSSAISGNGRTFDTSTSVEWQISYDSSEGSGSLDPYTASSTTPLGVAEIQALVTCTGPRPEQGGCGG